MNAGCVIANKNKKQEAYLAILGSLLFQYRITGSL